MINHTNNGYRPIDSHGCSNIGEACRFFHVSRSTWRRWEARGILPVKGRLINGLVRYRNSEMLAALDQAEVA